METNSGVYVAGHRGLVGSAIVRILEQRGFVRVLKRTREELDLLDQAAVRRFFGLERPEFVFVAAAKVGGIVANDSQPAEFLYENLQIQNNLIHEACVAGVRKLLFLGSSCIYPRLSAQPIREESLLSGPLEPTNEPYAVAKIAGIKMCDAYRRQHGSDFISVMPTNLYGPNDNYHPTESHALPALIRRFHEAKVRSAQLVTCWGTGTPKREFLYVDDLAEACLCLMDRYGQPGPINVGSGCEVTIRELATKVAGIVGYAGAIAWDETKPDGTPRKLLDSSRIRGLGWSPRTSLEAGIQLAYQDFLRRYAGDATI